MTPNEFHNWLAGFSAACKSRPTQDQWNEIKRRIESVGALKRKHMEIALQQAMISASARQEPVPYQYTFDEDGVTVCTPFGSYTHSDDDPKN